MAYDYHIVLGAVSVLLGLLGYGLYFRSIFRGNTRPHLFTWVTYALIDATVFVAQVLKGAGPGSWTLLLGVIGNIIVAFSALRLGQKYITKIDLVSFIAALIGIVLWWLTDDALIAVVIASSVNILGVLPTFRKAYARPDQESITIWSMDIIRFATSLIAIVAFNFTTALFPAIVVLTNATLVGMILIRRRVLAMDKTLQGLPLE